MRVVGDLAKSLSRAAGLQHLTTKATLIRRALTAAFVAALLLIAIDLSAYWSAFIGQQNLAAFIYKKLPVSTLVGLNPAASLEFLAGAYVEAGKYQSATKLFGTIASVRSYHFGPQSEKMAAINTDYGDLYVKAGDIAAAEQSYKSAIAMAESLRPGRGTGRAYTKLGKLYSDSGRLDEAATNYQKALVMRSNQFGPENAKVAETLFAYSVLLDRQGKSVDAKAASMGATAILNKLRKSDTGGGGNALILLAVSMLGSWFLFGKRGILTKLAVRQLRARVESDTVSPQDLKTLALLCQYQNLDAEAASYRERATSLK